MRSLATVIVAAFAAIGAAVVGRALGARLAGGGSPEPTPPAPDPERPQDIDDAVEVPCSSRSKG